MRKARVGKPLFQVFVHISAKVMVNLEHVVVSGMIGAEMIAEQLLTVPADDGVLRDILCRAKRFIAKQRCELCFHAFEIHSLAHYSERLIPGGHWRRQEAGRNAA